MARLRFLIELPTPRPELPAPLGYCSADFRRRFRLYRQRHARWRRGADALFASLRLMPLGYHGRKKRMPQGEGRFCRREEASKR